MIELAVSSSKLQIVRDEFGLNEDGKSTISLIPYVIVIPFLLSRSAAIDCAKSQECFVPNIMRKKERRANACPASSCAIMVHKSA